MVKKSYVIAGPTASGKSDFAHKLAKRLGGTIINADSVQIYRGIENISASPLAGQETSDGGCVIDGVPYKLFSVRDLSEQVTIVDYLEMARAEFDAAEVPIFVGGSGYYIGALLSGISPIPAVSPGNRERARKMVAEAPDAARKLTDFEFTDPQRMTRALEVFLETGRPISEWQKLSRTGAVCPAALKILISPPAGVLESRIRARLESMLGRGGTDEVRNHMEFRARAIGIDEIGKYISGAETLEQALENWAVRTRRYAKRQRTWFKNQYAPDMTIPRVPTDKDLEYVPGR
ncbi:MAG: tRNA (adenosine(37)-N6)-dimethylallyltransferase MiaA [Rickettsiales bacterium]|jgi:tRNA dimethylallyltransferase|nr:tRNA (adenosine(37)-N6)-dimethylallyltransferase MiaA [Rickettsiales bacterium]